MSAQLNVLAAPLLVGALLLAVLLLDLALGARGKGALGPLCAGGLLAVLALSARYPAGEAFGGAFVHDSFTRYLQAVLLAAGALGCLGGLDHARRQFPRRQGEYFLLLLFSLMGMLLLAGARELVLLVVAFELMGIPLYVLAAMQRESGEATEGALKLYLTGAVSSAVTLYGLSFLMGAAGSTRIADLGAAAGSPELALGLLLTLAGMSFKIGAAPFHMWIPDTYQSAPAPFVAFLSVAPKAAAFGALARLYVEGLGPQREVWWPVMLGICALTMLVGNLFALSQANVKRLLGYSGIAHIGLLVLALGIGTPHGVGVLLFYLVAYVFTNMGAFFVAEAVGSRANDELSSYRGLARRNPALALAMLLFLLSLGGIPFVAGFWAKLLLFWAAWEAGMRWMVLLGAGLAVLALFYYLRVARSIYIEKPESAGPLPVGRATALAIAIAVAGVVAIGVRPAPLVESALRAARSLAGG